MEKLKTKHEQLSTALDRLKEAINHLEKSKSYAEQIQNLEAEDMYRSFRDSLIQRFEFCSDLFWKYIKRYMDKKMKQPVEFNAPKPVIRTACKAKLITEQDAEKLLEMIEDRNASSHIYKEEIADQIGLNTKKYYKLMREYTNKLAP